MTTRNLVTDTVSIAGKETVFSLLQHSPLAFNYSSTSFSQEYNHGGDILCSTCFPTGFLRAAGKPYTCTKWERGREGGREGGRERGRENVRQ